MPKKNDIITPYDSKTFTRTEIMKRMREVEKETPNNILSRMEKYSEIIKIYIDMYNKFIYLDNQAKLREDYKNLQENIKQQIQSELSNYKGNDLQFQKMKIRVKNTQQKLNKNSSTRFSRGFTDK